MNPGTDWIDSAREQLRREHIRARTTLADLITDDDPRAAADLLTAATALDPMLRQHGTT